MDTIFEEVANERSRREQLEKEARLRRERSVEAISERCRRIVADYYNTHAPSLEVTSEDVDLYRFEKNPEGWFAEFDTPKDAEKTAFQFTLWYDDELLQLKVFTFVDQIDFPMVEPYRGGINA